MAKRVDTESAMDNLLQGTEREGSKAAPEASVKAPRSGMEMCHLRFPREDVRKMKAFAQANSISLSSAIRLAVSEFMQRRGLK